jgi:hypothetical protein
VPNMRKAASSSVAVIFASSAEFGDIATVSDFPEDERPTLSEQISVRPKGSHPSGLEAIELAVLMPYALGGIVIELWAAPVPPEHLTQAAWLLEKHINSAQVWIPPGLFEKLARRVETVEAAASVLGDVLRLLALTRIRQEILTAPTP